MQVSTIDAELIATSIMNRVFTRLSPKYTYQSQKEESHSAGSQADVTLT